MADKDLFAAPTEDELQAVKPKSEDHFAPPTAEELQAIKGEKGPVDEGSFMGIPALRTIIAGLNKGSTLGLGPLISAVPATVARRMALPENADESLLQSYQEVLPDVQADYRSAEEANPKTAFASELAGGMLIPAAGATKIAKGAGGVVERAAEKAIPNLPLKGLAKNILSKGTEFGTAGALYGGAAGVGGSESLGDIPKNALQGAETGAVFGGLLGSASGTLKSGKETVQNLLSKLKLGQTVQEAAEQGAKGNILATSESANREMAGRHSLAQKLNDLVLGKRDQFTNKLETEGLKQTAGKEIGKIIEQADKSGKTVDMTKELDEVFSALERLKAERPFMAEEADDLQRLISLWREGNTVVSRTIPTQKVLRNEIGEEIGVKAKDYTFKGKEGMPVGRKASELRDLEAKLRGAGGNYKSFEVQQMAKDLQRKMSGAIDELVADPLTDKKYAYSAMSRLDDGSLKIRTWADIQELSGPTANKATQDAQQTVKSYLDAVRTMKPELAASLQQEIEAAGRLADVSKAATAQGLPTGLGSLITGTVKGGVVNVANVGSYIPKNPKALSEAIANRYGDNAAGRALAKMVEQFDMKDPQRQQAWMFALMQNPMYRDMLKDFFPKAEEK